MKYVTVNYVTTAKLFHTHTHTHTHTVLVEIMAWRRIDSNALLRRVYSIFVISSHSDGEFMVSYKLQTVICIRTGIFVHFMECSTSKLVIHSNKFGQKNIIFNHNVVKLNEF